MGRRLVELGERRGVTIQKQLLCSRVCHERECTGLEIIWHCLYMKAFDCHQSLTQTILPISISG